MPEKLHNSGNNTGAPAWSRSHSCPTSRNPVPWAWSFFQDRRAVGSGVRANRHTGCTGRKEGMCCSEAEACAWLRLRACLAETQKSPSQAKTPGESRGSGHMRRRCEKTQPRVQAEEDLIVPKMWMCYSTYTNNHLSEDGCLFCFPFPA